MEHLIATKHFT